MLEGCEEEEGGGRGWLSIGTTSQTFNVLIRWILSLIGRCRMRMTKTMMKTITNNFNQIVNLQSKIQFYSIAQYLTLTFQIHQS